MRDINTFLPFWERFSVVTIKPDGDTPQIDLTPHANRFPSCGGCQKPCSTTQYCRTWYTAPGLWKEEDWKLDLFQIRYQTWNSV